MIATTNLFDNYDTEDTVKAELNNNLTIINEIVRNKKIKGIPEFFILGGAALVFHNLNYKSTLDIDTANRISSDIRKEVELFIDDAASEVAILPYFYQNRAKIYREDLDCIKVYILSEEDLVINKILCGRRKDFSAVKTSGILKRIDRRLLNEIVENELQSSHREIVSKFLGG